VITEKFRPRFEKLLLALIFVALATSTILWTVRDKTPPAWDPSDHIRYAYDYYRLLAHADFQGFAREFFVTPHFYAPFVHLVSAAVFLAFGASRLTGIGVNLISLAAMLCAVASISRRLFARRDSITGAPETQAQIAISVLPALLACCYHFSAWLVHDAFLDFPLTAVVTVAFALLVRAGDFKVRRYAIAFGVAAGIGMLVKQTFAFFFILPALLVVFRVLRTRDRRAILNLALAGLILIVVAALWYAPHLHDVIEIYRENQRAAVSENEAPLFTFDSNFFYIHALLSMQMQLPLAVLFVAGVIYSFVRCRRQSLILHLWLLSGIAIFALVANKDVRYTVPVLPAAAILSTCWLREFKLKHTKLLSTVKLALVAIVAAWALVSFFNAQWPAGGYGTAIDTPRYRWMVYSRNYYGFDHRPLNDDWGVPEIVRTISTSPQQDTMEAHAEASHSSPVLGVVVNLPYLNPSSVALYSRLMSSGRAAPPLIDVRWVVEPSMLDRIPDCDFLLVRTGLDKAEWVAPVEREVERLIRDHPDQFTQEASFPVPLKDAEAIIYRRRKP
jgi:4-amino-4-deoxy-L-arabinose transferase-like glycosyltransferase